MDCSSPYAMASMLELKDRYRRRLRQRRRCGPPRHRHAVGGTAESQPLSRRRDPLSADAPAGLERERGGRQDARLQQPDRPRGRAAGPRLLEVPVGFKWFAPGLFDGSVCFGGEESAGASFLRRDGTVWTTDKDGLILALLAAEITARTGKDPGEHYRELTAQFGTPHYTRIDAPATPEQKARLANLSPEAVRASALAGEPITAKLTRAPGNGAPIGGLKVVTDNGWFAARPSGTENIYKIYAESCRDEHHLKMLVAEAQQIVTESLG